MEGKLPVRILCELAEMDEMPEELVERLRIRAEHTEAVLDGLGLCLSEDGDLLSQWRGYAKDGTGLSIGFSQRHLNETSEQQKLRVPPRGAPYYTLQKVEYDKKKHIARIKPIYEEAQKHIENGAFDYEGSHSHLRIRRSDEPQEQIDERIRNAYTQLGFSLMPIVSELFQLKSDAFSEEKEWRLVSYSSKDGVDKCEYRSADDRIIPFREYKLTEIKSPPIIEVIKGPKNRTPDYVLKNMLNQNGFKNVKVTTSKLTYR